MKSMNICFRTFAIRKSMEFYLNKTGNATNLIKKIENSININQMWIEGHEDNCSIKVFHKMANKISTKNLINLSIDDIWLTVKDLIKIIHNWDFLLKLYLCCGQVYSTVKQWKINEKARFKLEWLQFDDWDGDFELDDLAQVLINNESLKNQLTIEKRTDDVIVKWIVLKNLNS